MPKILTSAMRAHLDEETTRLAAIWRITRKDGAQFFFTDHDRDIVLAGDTYRADAGFERTAIRERCRVCRRQPQPGRGVRRGRHCRG